MTEIRGGNSVPKVLRMYEDFLVYGRFKDALSYLDELKSVDEKTLPLVNLGYARVYAEIGANDKANAHIIETLTSAADIDISEIMPYCHIIRALIELQTGNTTKAKSFFQKIAGTEISTLHDQLEYFSALFQLKEGKTNEAGEKINKKIESLINSDTRDNYEKISLASFYILASDISYENGEYDNSKEYLQSALEIASTNKFRDIEWKVLSKLSNITGKEKLSEAKLILSDILNDIPTELKNIYVAKDEVRQVLSAESLKIQEAKTDVSDELSENKQFILSMIAGIIEEGLDLEKVVSKSLNMVMNATGSTRGCIILLSEKGDIDYQSSYGLSQEEISASLNASSGVIKKVAESAEAVFIKSNIKKAWAYELESIHRLRIESVICVPIKLNDRLVGVMYLDKRNEDQFFTDEDFRLVKIFGNQISKLLYDAKKLNKETARVKELTELVDVGLKELSSKYRLDNIVGRSKAMQDIFYMIKKLAMTDYPVILEGETGVGKELLAKAIHFNSARKEKPFIPINCTAISETLLESELFGYTKGAFTGANEDRKGLFELSDGGSLMLDEIEEMSESMQKKLLRVLEEGKILPVGGKEYVQVNVRIIAATNRKLKELVQMGKFREDLYYRLSTFLVQIPPLRERIEDIPLVVDYLMDQIAQELNIQRKTIADDTMKIITSYHWPGNGRELRNELRKACVIARGDVITPMDISNVSAKIDAEPSKSTQTGDFVSAFEDFEKNMILQALEKHNWNLNRTARALRTARNTLKAKIKKYLIMIPRKEVGQWK